jgi:IclR family mhp operon transcriptional activator
METKVISVLQRGLEILEALNRPDVRHVRQLHRLTGLPKPTIVRLLDSLVGLGFVARMPGGGYEVTGRVMALSHGHGNTQRLLKAAGPALESLRRGCAWPADLAIADFDAMRVVDVGNGPGSPLLNRTPGYKLPMAGSALGRAYLAFCPKEERAELMARLAEDMAAAGEGQHFRALTALLSSVRRKGIATRDCVRGKATRVVAKPVLVGDRVVACLSIVVGANAMSLDDMERVFAAPLASAAQAIAQSYGNA